MSKDYKFILKKTHRRVVLIKNFIFLMLLQIMRYFIPILVLPYITRIIGVVHFGEISVAISTCMIMQIIVDYGFNFLGTREVATHKKDLKYISYLYSAITCARCILFIICSIIMMAVTFFIPYMAEIRLLIFICLFPVFFSIFMPEWMYQGLEEMEFITYIHVISRIIYVILIFTLIKQEDDYILYPIFNLVGLLFASVASLIILRKKQIKLHLVSYKTCRNFFKDAKDLFINEVCASLLSHLSNIMVGTFLSFRDAGIYTSSGKLIIGLGHGHKMIHRVFYPFLAQHGNKFKNYFFINLIISFVVSSLTFAFTPMIYSIFYPNEFSEGIKVMQIAAIGLLFNGISGSLSSNYLIVRKRERIVRNISIFILIFGSFLFITAMLRFGLIGAAVAAMCNNFIRFLLLAYFCYRYRKMKLAFRK